MNTTMDEDVKRWTARRKSALTVRTNRATSANCFTTVPRYTKSPIIHPVQISRANSTLCFHKSNT